MIKVGGKMFVLVPLFEEPRAVNLGCDPAQALEPRKTYAGIRTGYHQNKRHWTTVHLDGSVEDDVVAGLITDSDDLVVAGLPTTPMPTATTSKKDGAARRPSARCHESQAVGSLTRTRALDVAVLLRARCSVPLRTAETSDGARQAGVNVALAQHVMPLPAGRVGTRPGPVLSAADSMRITVHGRGAHGSMPQAAVDAVVVAARILVRLQTVVAREVPPAETLVLTVGSLQAGTKSNVIPDLAVRQLNLRSYCDATRSLMLEAIQRIVTAECQASGTPRDSQFELYDRFPVVDNDVETIGRVAAAFADFLGDRAGQIGQQSASEHSSDGR